MIDCAFSDKVKGGGFSYALDVRLKAVAAPANSLPSSTSVVTLVSATVTMLTDKKQPELPTILTSELQPTKRLQRMSWIYSSVNVRSINRSYRMSSLGQYRLQMGKKQLR